MSALVEPSPQGIKLSDKLVFANVSSIWDRSKILLLSNKNTSVNIDCNAVSHIDSAGLALMIEWKKWCHQHKKECCFVGLQDQATTLIKTYKLEDILL